MHTEFRIAPGSVITVLVILVGAWALWYLRDLALLVLTAIVIASAIEPGVAFFVRTRVPRVLAALLMYALVIGGVFVILYFFFPPIIDDAQRLLASVPQYLDTLNLPQSLITSAGAGQHQAQSTLATLLTFRDAFANTSEGVIRLVATFFGGIFAFFLVIVLSFYFAVQETGIADFLRLITPAKQEEYVVDLWKRAQKKIGLWMQGQLLLSLIVGVLVYLGLVVMGIPYAFLLAVFTAIAEVIPIFGSLIAGAAAAAVGYVDGGFALAFVVAGLYVVVNQFEVNLIYPLVVKKVIGLPPLLVIVALVAGSELAGFLGALLAVPVAAAFLEFLSDLDRGKRAPTPHRG